MEKKMIEDKKKNVKFSVFFNPVASVFFPFFVAPDEELEKWEYQGSKLIESGLTKEEASALAAKLKNERKIHKLPSDYMSGRL